MLVMFHVFLVPWFCTFFTFFFQLDFYIIYFYGVTKIGCNRDYKGYLEGEFTAKVLIVFTLAKFKFFG